MGLITIANIICLAIGWTCAFKLMRDTTGTFALQKADTRRMALAFGLCFFGGWFCLAGVNSSFYWFDAVAVGVLAVLALASVRYPPIEA